MKMNVETVSNIESSLGITGYSTGFGARQKKLMSQTCDQYFTQKGASLRASNAISKST